MAGPSIFDYIMVALVSHMVDCWMVVPPISVDRPTALEGPHLLVVSVPKRGLSMEALEIVSLSLLVKDESFEVRTILNVLRLPEVERAVWLPPREDLTLERSVWSSREPSFK